MAKTFSETAWLAELQKLTQPVKGKSEGFLTAREIGAKTGRSVVAVRKLLRLAADKKLLEVRREARPRVDGMDTPTSCYRVKKA